MTKELWSLEIKAPKKDYDPVLGLLALNINYGWEEKEVDETSIQFLVHNESGVFLEELLEMIMAHCPMAIGTLTKIENTDFLSSWKEFFTPVSCGNNFVILPPWLKEENFPDRSKIIIEPKSAFGTGHHATTTLCLEALDELIISDRLPKTGTFLDLGCGTGILGIAAALAGLSGFCVDIDPLAVANARENASLNHASAALKIVEGSIDAVKGLQFDLILANILAEPLIQMACAITSSLAEGGCIILSGILEKQAESVIDAFINCSMPQPLKLVSGEWCALVWS